MGTRQHADPRAQCIKDRLAPGTQTNSLIPVDGFRLAVPAAEINNLAAGGAAKTHKNGAFEPLTTSARKK
jgi:hypothetical protein